MNPSRKNLHKLRSGQTVYRVLFSLKGVEVAGSIETVHLLGKRVLITYKSIISEKVFPLGIKMRWKNPKQPQYDRGWFLGDLAGHGCFRSRRRAERFVKETELNPPKELLADLIETKEDWDRYKSLN